jgi:Leucine-rich repeat (LRR) protein
MEIFKDRIIQLKNGSISIDLSNMGLTEIPDLSMYAGKLVKLNLSHNKITNIVKLDALTNLQKLFLYNNQITKIEGLETLTNLQLLWLYGNKITKIEGLNTLTILQELDLSYNKITKIEGLDTLTNLHELDLSYNKITKIEGLNTLTNLEKLNLWNNKITKIEGLNTLTNLKKLYLSFNQITKIEGLNTLTNLEKLNLWNNKITKIEGFDALTNLQRLYLSFNQITEIPQNILNLRNLQDFKYYDNPINYISPNIVRFLSRINNIYNDRQNVHDSNIQLSFRNSLNVILKDKPFLIEDVINEINQNDLIDENVKRSILEWIDIKDVHSTHLITFEELLCHVWKFISGNNEIIKVFNDNMNDSMCLCFTGRITRLVSTLDGFVDGVRLEISDNQQIGAIIVKAVNEGKTKEEIKELLLERGFSDIEEWLIDL